MQCKFHRTHFHFCSGITCLAGWTVGATGIHGQFPPVTGNVVTDDVECPVAAPHFEIAVIRGQPAVDDLGHLDLPVMQEKTARRLFPAITGMALNRDGKGVHLTAISRF